MAADVGLEYPAHSGEASRGRQVDEVVDDVLRRCRRFGRPADPDLVRELVEGAWVGYADARVQTYLPVLVGRAVSAQLLQPG